VTPLVALTLPLPGAASGAEHAFASHVGAGELNVPAAVHDVDVAPFSV
jgi:hypothetical protein